MTLPNMHDSGKREAFSTGAVRDTADGKPRPDLISPHADLREGAWLAKGAEKYKERNWEAGINISRCIASLERHLMAYKMGLTDEDHMAAIRTNAGFILHYEEEIKAGRLDPKIDDMPKYTSRPPVFEVSGPLTENMANVAAQEKPQRWGGYVVAPPTVEGEIEYIGSCVNCGSTRAVDEYYVCPDCGWDVSAVPPTMNAAIIKGVSTKRKTATESEFDPMPKFNPETMPVPTRMDCPRCECEIRPSIDPSLETRCGNCGWIPATDTIAQSPGSVFYVAGPMRGYKGLNFSAFDKARRRGEAKGYRIISPADMDRYEGIDPNDPEDPKDMRGIIERDVAAILTLDPKNGDGLAVLGGWRDSIGATVEVALARWLELPVVWATDFHTPVGD